MLISNWNNVVKRNDEIYILGDMFWKNVDFENILKRLKGKKFLISGNHDRINVDMRKYFVWIKPYEEIKDNNRSVILCHYPILFYKKSYDKDTYMLCGHVHVTKENELLNRFRKTIINEKNTDSDGFGHIINVGCMLPYMNYTPQTLEYLIKNGYNEV